MDVRAKIVDQVLESLPDLSADIRDRIERTLLTSLQGYEVQERCTDVTVHDNTNIGFVRKFIATKKLEGKSERTLRRYQPELEKLVSFLDKKFYEVSPYDLRLYLSLYKEQRQLYQLDIQPTYPIYRRYPLTGTAGFIIEISAEGILTLTPFGGDLASGTAINFSETFLIK